MNAYQGWTAVATSEYIRSDRPVGIVAHGVELVLYRDQNAAVRVLEDRCPHRRVPLSLGKVCEGRIRCAYHGWSFDGATGACVDIPNLDSAEKVSPRYRVKLFSVCERDGFVFVAFSDAVEVDQCPTADIGIGTKLEQSQRSSKTYGNCRVAMPVTEYIAALLDGPETLMRLRGVGVSDFFLGDPACRGNWLVCDREASWSRCEQPPGIKAIARPLILRVEIGRDQFMAKVWLLNAAEEPLAVVILGFSAGLRSTTTVCWRYYQFQAWSESAPLWLRLHQMLGLPVVDVHSAVAGEAVAGLLPGPSKHLGMPLTHQHEQEQVTGEGVC